MKNMGNGLMQTLNEKARTGVAKGLFALAGLGAMGASSGCSPEFDALSGGLVQGAMYSAVDEAVRQDIRSGYPQNQTQTVRYEQPETQTIIDSDGNKRVVSARAATGKITKVDTEFIQKEGEWYMITKTDLQIKDNMGWPNQLDIYFYDEKGDALVDKDGNYKSLEGYVAHSHQELLIPPYVGTTYTDVEIVFPLNQLDITAPGKHKIQYCLILWDNSNKNNSRKIAVSPIKSLEYTIGQ